MKKKLIHITGYVCEWELRVRVVQKPCERVPCKQRLPACAVCSWSDLPGSAGRRLPWSQQYQLQYFCKHLPIAQWRQPSRPQVVTEVIAGLALPLSWVPAQVHCVCLLPAGVIISPVTWSRNKEGASPSTVPFCLWTSTVNRAKRFWSEILACETDVVPPPFILWFLPVLGRISCRNSYWTHSSFGACSTSSSAAFPGEPGMLQGGQELPWLCSVSASGCPRVLLNT